MYKCSNCQYLLRQNQTSFSCICSQFIDEDEQLLSIEPRFNRVYNDIISLQCPLYD